MTFWQIIEFIENVALGVLLLASFGLAFLGFELTEEPILIQDEVCYQMPLASGNGVHTFWDVSDHNYRKIDERMVVEVPCR